MIEHLSPNVNSKDHKGWTPLMNAAFNNHARILRILLSNEADINLKNNLDMNACDFAKTKEIKNILDEETRKKSLFNFEQMLELEMSFNSPGSLLDTTLMNSYGSEDQELGNREIFEKMTKCSKLSRFAKPKKKVISRPDSLNKPVIKINNKRLKGSFTPSKRKESLRKSMHLFQLGKKPTKLPKNLTAKR